MVTGDSDEAIGGDWPSPVQHFPRAVYLAEIFIIGCTQDSLVAGLAADYNRAVARTAPASILRGVRVLVVDDDDDARELLASIFEIFSAEVVSAGGAREALHVARRLAPHVVVTDLMMPGEDGYWLLRQLRDETPALPVITVSGVANNASEVLAEGFDGYFRKPYDPDALVALVVRISRT